MTLGHSVDKEALLIELGGGGVLIIVILVMIQFQIAASAMDRLEHQYPGWALVLLVIVVGTDALFGLIIFGLGSAWVVPGFGDLRGIFWSAVVLLPVWIYHRLVKFVLEQRRATPSA